MKIQKTKQISKEVAIAAEQYSFPHLTGCKLFLNSLMLVKKN